MKIYMKFMVKTIFDQRIFQCYFENVKELLDKYKE